MIHDEVAVHTKHLLVQRFNEKVCVLQLRRHIDYLNFLLCNMLPNEAVMNIDVLRVGGGGWVVGQMERSYVVLLNHSALIKLQRCRMKIASFNLSDIATYSASSVKDSVTLF